MVFDLNNLCNNAMLAPQTFGESRRFSPAKNRYAPRDVRLVVIDAIKNGINCEKKWRNP